MAKLISKTYGDALFSLAVEENKIDEFIEEITGLLAILRQEEDFSKLMYWDNLPVSVLDYRYMDSWKYMTEEKNDYNDPKKLYSDLLKEAFGILNKDPQDKKKRK